MTPPCLQGLLQAVIATVTSGAAVRQLPEPQLSALITDITSDCRSVLQLVMQSVKAASVAHTAAVIAAPALPPAGTAAAEDLAVAVRQAGAKDAALCAFADVGAAAVVSACGCGREGLQGV